MTQLNQGRALREQDTPELYDMSLSETSRSLFFAESLSSRKIKELNIPPALIKLKQFKVEKKSPFRGFCFIKLYLARKNSPSFKSILLFYFAVRNTILPLHSIVY